MATSFKEYNAVNDTKTLVFIFMDGFIPDLYGVVSPEEFSSNHPNVDVQNSREIEVYVTVASRDFDDTALSYMVPDSTEFFAVKDKAALETDDDETKDLYEAANIWFKALRVSIYE